MNTKLRWKLTFIFLSFLTLAFSQPGLNLEPGVARWDIKISAENFTTNDNARFVPLEELMELPLLENEYSTKKYNKILIPAKVRTLQEGDIISTIGYLHLVALENSSRDHRDGDYHIQLTLKPVWGDSCFIVEIPYEEFVSNPELKVLSEKNRKFIRERLLHDVNKQPSSGGNVMKREVYVRVTGQLFYDASHAGQMRNPDPDKRHYRGKKGRKKTPMHSYTAWEIHPVTNIEFAPKPSKKVIN